MIYVHREVGKRDAETKERKPVDFCMSRSKGASKGKNIQESIDIQSDEVVISAVDSDSVTCLNFESTGDKKMPFVGFDKAKLQEKFPTTVGRAGKPSVAVAGNGRVQFSVEVSKAFDGCKVLSPAFEAGTNRLRLEGLAETPKGKETSVWDIVRAKEGGKNKNKTVSVSGALLMKAVGYDYKAAGNQTFDIDKQDNDKHVIIFTLPKETPKPKPVVERKKKAPKTVDPVQTTLAAAASAGSKAAMGQKPADEVVDDVIIDE